MFFSGCAKIPDFFFSRSVVDQREEQILEYASTASEKS
jgi:hypothetical protein